MAQCPLCKDRGYLVKDEKKVDCPRPACKEKAEIVERLMFIRENISFPCQGGG